MGSLSCDGAMSVVRSAGGSGVKSAEREGSDEGEKGEKGFLGE